jgi:hypothetical protein
MLEGVVEACVHAFELVAAVWVARIGVSAGQSGRFSPRECLPPRVLLDRRCRR